MAPRRSKRRYKRRRRFDIKKASSRVKGPLLAKLILAAAVIAGILFLCCRADSLFKDNAFFTVSKIELTMRPFLKEALSLDFYDIPHRSNIFRLNIDRIGADTQRRHPEFKSVAIRRKPPNVISIRIKYKEPWAFLRIDPQHKFFYGRQEIVYPVRERYALVPISSDGIVLPPDAAAGKILSVIWGMDFQIYVVKVGSFCPDKKLPLAIKFLRSLGSYWSIKNHRPDIINFSNTKDILIFLENGIEVKMGDAGALKDKLIVLKNILENPRLDLAKIKYIDLRFSDVLIGPK